MGSSSMEKFISFFETRFILMRITPVSADYTTQKWPRMVVNHLHCHPPMLLTLDNTTHTHLRQADPILTLMDLAHQTLPKRRHKRCKQPRLLLLQTTSEQGSTGALLALHRFRPQIAHRHPVDQDRHLQKGRSTRTLLRVAGRMVRQVHRPRALLLMAQVRVRRSTICFLCLVGLTPF